MSGYFSPAVYPHPACVPQAAAADDSTHCAEDSLLGVAWNGDGCVFLLGCTCVGDGCAALFNNFEECQAYNAGCV